MKKLYRISIWDRKISEIEVIKETEHTIWYNRKYTSCEMREVTERKNTGENKHFETYEEAKDYLIKICSEKVESYKSMLARAEKDLANVLLN